MPERSEGSVERPCLISYRLSKFAIDAIVETGHALSLGSLRSQREVNRTTLSTLLSVTGYRLP